MMDLTGINNYNEYYTNHYFASVFEENASETISAWKNAAKESEELRTPWSLLRECAKLYYTIYDKSQRVKSSYQILPMIKDLADICLESLGFPKAEPFCINTDDGIKMPVYLEMRKTNGAPLLWVMLAHSNDSESSLMQSYCFDAGEIFFENGKTTMTCEELATKVLFSLSEPPRWIIVIGLNGIALIDRNKWNEKRYIQFDLQEIFSRREESTLQAMAVLLHKESLCPDEGISLLDKLDDNSHKHASGVSQDLKYALRSSIELLGNEVLYDMKHRLNRDLENDPVDAGQLTLECLRYMYRMLFVLFIESRPELGYAPIKSQAYFQGYSLESLRDIADNIREEIDEVGEGYYLHETLSKLYDLIYNGYPASEEELKQLSGAESLHDVFVIEPLKAHIFDPEYTKMITGAKIRNSVMLKIIEHMSVTRSTGRRVDRRGRISYSTLGINQMGAVYEALLSYRGFIASETLFEVKRERDEFDELDVGYFVPESELHNYTEEERVRYQTGENKGKLRKYEKGTFIYRLAGREREKSASYYTPEVLTKCLVKYALKELLEGKTADEILKLTICEPAMGSAAFLNEAINQLAEAYIDKKQKELGETISYEDRYQKIQQVKMYIADRNVYGIDLNPVAVELAEVSLWLNTINKGGFVPWFGTQLVNGNSLIGARRQCYRVESLTATQNAAKWYNSAPERIMPQEKRMPKKQVYHFLMGDPGMASYTDKVIKGLAPEEIKKIAAWNKKFIAPYDESDIESLLRISKIVDTLWEKQVELRREVGKKTADALAVYGHKDDSITDSRTTIREKDWIYKKLYKSEEMENAGPYARLKFAMDYWCSLWFWPIEKADLLPTRSEFLFDMSLILEGGIVSINKVLASGQMSLFPTPIEEMAQNIISRYDDLGKVDLQQLCKNEPRLQLAKEIAEKNKFFHWELEFADLFEERGGFDLIIGNPPWIKITWNEQAVLSDRQPLFGVKDFTATQTTQKCNEALSVNATRELYFYEYEATSGTQNFLNAIQNYGVLKGQQTNLFKCFLPQAWQFCGKSGLSSFIHPDSVYDDPNGGILREELYPRLRKHFQFINELKLFSEVDHHMGFSLNVYCNKPCTSFDTIANVFNVSTIEQCYDKSIKGPVPGIKDEENNWNIKGHPDRVVHIGKKELSLFARLFDGGDKWRQARLPALHARQLIDVLECLVKQERTIDDLQDEIFSTVMWDETNAQNDGTIVRNVHFPESTIDMIYSGPHIGVANPLFKTSRSICNLNSDYDSIDLATVNKEYLQRCNYSPERALHEFVGRIPTAPWGGKYHETYRVIARKMLNISGERTLIAGIIPVLSTHTNGLIGFAFKDQSVLVSTSALFASIPYDFFIKVMGKSNLYEDNAGKMPMIESKYNTSLCVRSLILNCLTQNYSALWIKQFNETFKKECWAKQDSRLPQERFKSLTPEWKWDIPLRSDYERRQALVEIDVLTAMALGMNLDQLKTIYRIQFPVLQSYEADTWYDQNGRIVFTNNRSLTNVGFTRPEWEAIKDAESGIFTRIIIDDTLPGGPVKRTIEYVAPFDRCDREQDYETAWKFFEKKFKDIK